METLRYGRVFGIPIWAIGVGIAGAILLFVIWRNKSMPHVDTSGSPEAQIFDGTAPEGDGVYGLPPGSIGDYLNSDPTNPAYPVGMTSTGIPGPITNDQWSRLVFNKLVVEGGDSTLIERALAKYLQGLSLTAQEQAVINMAHQLFGAPPEGLILHETEPQPEPETPSTPTNPNPPDKPKTPKPETYVVKSGDNLSKIAGMWGTTHTAVYNKNKAVIEAAAIAHGLKNSSGGPNKTPGWWIYPGTRLVKP